MSSPIPIPLYTYGTRLADVFSAFWGNYVLPGYGEMVYWLQKIGPDTPGATPTWAWDSVRKTTTSFTDGSFGAGWKVTDPTGVLINGYFGPVIINCGINEVSRIEELTPDGLVLYQGPSVLYQDPTVFTKGDILVRLSDLQRYVVGDEVYPGQVWGSTVIKMAKLEERAADNIVYQVPLT